MKLLENTIELFTSNFPEKFFASVLAYIIEPISLIPISVGFIIGHITSPYITMYINKMYERKTKKGNHSV